MCFYKDLSKIKYFNQLQALNLNKNEFVIIGSSCLARENIGINERDIDIIVSKTIWNKLLHLYIPQKSESGRNHIHIGNIDISDKVLNYTNSQLEEFLADVNIIEGYRFLSIDKCLYLKSICSREKDIEFFKRYSEQIDEYFMNVAKKYHKKSSGYVTKVGAVLVNENKRIISTGINSLPEDLQKSHPEMYNLDETDLKDNKRYHVTHDEMNSIVTSKQKIKNCTLYVTHFPCDNCARLIIPSGINRVVYSEITNKERYYESKYLLELQGVMLKQIFNNKS